MRSGRVANVPEAGARCDRELHRVVEPRVEERAAAVHLEIGDEGVPVRDTAPARPGVQIDACQAERGRDERRGGAAVGLKGLAVERQLGVELPRAPAVEDRAHGGLVDAQEIDERLHAGSQRDDRADVQVAVRPAVEASTDARRQLVVDRGMAQRALDADRAELALVEETGDADDGVEAQESDRGRWSVEVDLAALEGCDQIGRQAVRVDLEADRQSGARTDAGAHAAERLTGDRLVEAQRAAPEGFVAEGVVAEDLAALGDHLPRVALDGLVEGVLRRFVGGDGAGGRLILGGASCGLFRSRPSRGGEQGAGGR